VKVLVTGATGKVGHAVARALATRGDEVRALVRDPERAAGVLPSGVEPVRGDALDTGSLAEAVRGCELVFNAMGLPEQWLADDGLFPRVNARGSENVARAARARRSSSDITAVRSRSARRSRAVPVATCSWPELKKGIASETTPAAA